ncbi:hypothetical protein [Streptomyces luteogriseus]|uniref:hypothetical protein n=1 Tax=Streptomyces luteogriseus TaxID=68233 RepID=UPI0037B1CD51
MSQRPPHSPCRRNDRHDAHEFEVYGRPFWCPGFAPSGPACGNNPNYRMSDGDRQAVEAFQAYLADRAALERVRAVLETEAVVGRSALEYRGLIASALMADKAQPTQPQQDEADRIVAYRSPLGHYLHCPRHADELGLAWRPLSADDLPDGGICSYPRCGVDVLIPQEARPFVPPAHYRRDDGVDCCVHTIPVGPDSCPACLELHDDEQAAAGAQQDGAQR